MSVPMVSDIIGYGISGTLNGISIIFTLAPLISLIMHYSSVNTKSNDNNKVIMNESMNENNTKSEISGAFSYGEYTFTDNLKPMKRATITCLLSFFVRSIVSLMLDIGRGAEIDVNILTILIVLQSLLYFIGKVCVYYIFILRIIHSFKGNNFAVSKVTIIILVSIFIAMTVGFVVMVFVLMFASNILAFGIVAGICFICDTVLSISIVILFIKRLKMISKEFGYNYNMNELHAINAVSGNESENCLNDQKLNYIDIITRYSLISFIAISTCIVWEYLVAADTLSIAFNSSLNTKNEISVLKLIQWIVLPVDAIANVWCIYFNNAFSTNMYNKLCGTCHKSCKKCST